MHIPFFLELRKMNVLVIGSGGREHTLAWKIAQSPNLGQLFVSPGNAGTAEIAKNVSLDYKDVEVFKQFLLQEKVKLVVIGPEAPLVDGLADQILDDPDLSDVLVVGPREAAAELEGSKEFAKDFMQRHEIPTARYQSFEADRIDEAKAFLNEMNPPYVLKADGLAAGKGVLILDEQKEAERALDEMLLDKKFGAASSKVVIEEFLSGIELSVFVLTDGQNYVVLPEAKDYKRIGEGDTGLNTGGMGAVSPVPFADESFMNKVHDRIVVPTIAGLMVDELPYCGFVFIGLMNVGGDPYVIEYNVRMGDPETEVVIPRIKSDLLELLVATADGTMDEVDVELDERSACTVMLVSGGYPESYEKGKKITGIERVKDSVVFHAGTKNNEKDILTNGGRVLALTSMGKDFTQALERSFRNAELIDFEGKYFRRDIGFDL
jgi:phosphoribosylamine--glycine ligase